MELLDSTRQVVSLLYLHRQYSVAELCLLLPQKVMMIAFRRDFADHAFLGHSGTYNRVCCLSSSSHIFSVDQNPGS